MKQMPPIAYSSRSIKRIFFDPDERLNVVWRVVLGWLTFVFALWLATIVGSIAERLFAMPLLGRHIIQAVVMSGVTIPLIYLLRRFVDRRPWPDLGLMALPRGFAYMILGASIAIVMASISLILSLMMGWLQVVALRLPSATLLAIAINIPIAFFYEALPEEVTFRGYVYHNLNTRFARWFAILLQILLFPLAPVVVGVLQTAVGLSANAITADYIIVLITFGFVLQICRIVTGNLWTSIGFHIAWLELSRFVIGRRLEPLVEVEGLVPGEADFLILFLGAIIGGNVALIVAHYLRGKKIGWRQRVADNAAVIAAKNDQNNR